MDKMRMESVDMTAQNIEKIGALFPNCITETVDENGKPKKAINFEILKQMLSGDVIEGSEAYEFSWVGKRAAIVEANKPIRKTLRPCKEESVDWDNTENLYIEGDNLEVLKLLQESYLGAIKMIYIDPPYNTGNDFIYRDDFKQSAVDYEEDLGVYDDDGNRMFKNTDSNGRFHSDWCSMIYSRLTLARNLLRDDGAIFISIDENEITNLKKICDEVFGEANFRTIITWQRKYSVSNNYSGLATICDYLLVYAKSDTFQNNLLPRTSDSASRYSNPDNDPRGPWKAVDYLNQATTSERPNLCYDIVNPNTGAVIKNKAKAWKYDRNTHLKHVQENRIWWGVDGKNTAPALKLFLSDVRDGMTPHNWWPYEEVGHTQEATKEVANLMGCVAFDYPKPLRFLKRILQIASDKDSIILDFFSGSASMAHAVMQMNGEDNGKRHFIMVQLPEMCDKKSEAYQAGYRTICDIGKERIRRAGKKIKEESPLTTQNLDIGFRAFKLDDTNMTDVYYSANEYSQDMLSMLESNVKADRTDLDLLFGCLLEWGLPLSLPYTFEIIEGCTVHTYNDGDLIACFDENIPDSVIKTIAKKQPLRAVFRDSSFANSPSKINVGEVFKLLAPDTRVKVI